MKGGEGEAERRERGEEGEIEKERRVGKRKTRKRRVGGGRGVWWKNFVLSRRVGDGLKNVYRHARICFSGLLSETGTENMSSKK